MSPRRDPLVWVILAFGISLYTFLIAAFVYNAVKFFSQ